MDIGGGVTQRTKHAIVLQARGRACSSSPDTTAVRLAPRQLLSAVMAVDMPQLDDVALAKLAAICQTSKSPEFFAEVRHAVELAHFRERLRRHAQSFGKIANAAATLRQHIDALGPDARATFEEILGKKNDIAQNLVELVEVQTAEHAANGEYEQQTPLLFAFVWHLSMFEGLAHWVAGLPVPYLRAPCGPGPRYIELGMNGRAVSPDGRRGRPPGSKALSSGYGNLEAFVDHLTHIVAESGGRLTFNDREHSGTLVSALKLLRNHLPPGCRAMPSKSTMRRIKERSTGHLHRSTPRRSIRGNGPCSRARAPPSGRRIAARGRCRSSDDRPGRHCACCRDSRPRGRATRRSLRDRVRPLADR